MKTHITGPFLTLGQQAAAKRKQAHKAAELRLLHKDLRRQADIAFTLDCPILGDLLLTAGEMAGNLATLTENQ